MLLAVLYLVIFVWISTEPWTSRAVAVTFLTPVTTVTHPLFSYLPPIIANASYYKQLTLPPINRA